MRCLELNENKEKNARRMTAVNPWKRHEQYALQQTSPKTTHGFKPATTTATPLSKSKPNIAVGN